MTEPNPPTGSSPLRVGGYVLLGIAAVAAVVGLVSLAGGGDSSNTAATPPSGVPVIPPLAASPPPAAPLTTAPLTTAPLTTAPPAGPVPSPARPSPSNLAAPPAAQPLTPAPTPYRPSHPNTERPLPGAGLPPENGSGLGKGSGSAGVAEQVSVRVYNNSLIKDLAQHAAEDFRAAGWHVDEVGNYAASIIPHSTVYYRPGTSEQAAAESLASSFGMRAEPRFPGLQNATPGLVVIVTKDFQHR